MLTALTADYRAAGFEVLERLATVTPEGFARFTAQQPGVRGGVLLATCNRFEAYLDVDDDSGAAAALQGFAEAQSGQALDGVLTARAGTEVAGHLFAVSSGLESLVVGEAEIAGQVSRALEAARAQGSTTPDLERLFQRASRTSSAVQERTRVGAAGRSIVRLALDLAGSRITDWRGVRVLLIGTGTYAGATLAALRDRGVEEIAVYSPSDRAKRFASREGVVAVPRDELPRRLGEADLVIACSIATTPILAAHHLVGARARVAHPDRQLVVDLGLPRNIDPDVAELPEVDLLDLETIGLHAPLPELQATDEARALIEQAVLDYRADQQATAVTPAVVAYRSHVFELVEQEIDRLRRRGEATESVERAMRHLASVLVHTPSARARELATQGRADEFSAAVQALFGLETAAPSALERDEPLAG
ncbi:glutamyl-tRNA reductase [Amnibacterium endophyticum]|uniref:Glutamyl-tRNA reductase n=1 Tax=Amnibacterium endophyticum TaxID=2109337 RepID=A0ABW4LA95_9MICO